MVVVGRVGGGWVGWSGWMVVDVGWVVVVDGWLGGGMWVVVWWRLVRWMVVVGWVGWWLLVGW